jgi:hypothetical protein
LSSEDPVVFPDDDGFQNRLPEEQPKPTTAPTKTPVQTPVLLKGRWFEVNHADNRKEEIAGSSAKRMNFQRSNYA